MSVNPGVKIRALPDNVNQPEESATGVNVPTASLILRWPLAVVLAILSMLLLPALTYSIIIHPPEYDELLHILAARSLNETGIPSIADGLYTRAELYTRLIAWVTGLADNELLIARFPALLFGMLATALLSAWMGVRVGWIAAIAVACIFVISPMTLNSAVLVRFYTLHTLLMAMLLLFWYEATSWQHSLRNLIIVVAISAVLIGLGLQFHDLTQITILSGLVAMTMVLVYDYRKAVWGIARRRPILTVLGLVTGIALAAYVAIRVDIISLLRGSLPLWSVSKADNYAYYLSALSVELPFIWPLFPVMLIACFYERPRIAVFCLSAFVVSLIVNSIAAQKATRYFYHAYPMFCILWAIGFQRLLMLVFTQLRAHRGAGLSTALIILGVLSISLISAHEVKRGIKLVLNKGQADNSIPVVNEPDWSLSLPRIGELAQSVDTLVVTSGVKGQYTFGKFDYEMSTTVVQETDTGLEFGNDPRTNRQVIGQPESVQRIIDAEGQALFVLEDRMINKQYSAPVESVTVLNRHCEAIDLSKTGSQLSAWLC